MSGFTAILDACVLYPAPLRDCFMWLATTGLFQAKWSAQIHEEWIRSVLENRSDLTRAQLERTRDLMDSHAGECSVTGHEDLIGSLSLPDPDDRHVLAAAIVGRADVIVTFNLKDFPTEKLAPYGVEAVHPDEFVCDLIDLDRASVITAIRSERESLKKPRRSASELLETLRGTGLSKAVQTLLPHAGEL